MEKELSKPQRLIAILIFLAQNRGNPVTTKDIKNNLEARCNEKVGIRAIQRDMQDLLNVPTVPVHCSGDQKNGFAYFISSPGFTKALSTPFSSNEAMAGYILNNLSPYFKNTSLEKLFNQLLEKVEDTMSDRVFEDLDAKKEETLKSIEFSPFGFFDFSSKEEIMNSLITAISEKRKVKLTYQSHDKPLTYVYHPLKILITKNIPYLFAHSDKHGWVSTFSVNKIIKIKVLSDTFEPEKEDLKKLDEIKDLGIGIYHKEDQKPEKVVLVFESWLKHRIKDKFWHSTQKVRELSNGKIELEMNVVVNEELISWIFYWQCWVRVSTPKSLADEIKGRAENIKKIY